MRLSGVGWEREGVKHRFGDAKLPAWPDASVAKTEPDPFAGRVGHLFRGGGADDAGAFALRRQTTNVISPA